MIYSRIEFGFRRRLLHRQIGRRAAGLCLIGLVFLAACTRQPQVQSQSPQGQSARPATPPAPVNVATVIKKDTVVELATFGHVEAYSSVEVKARITGYSDRGPLYRRANGQERAICWRRSIRGSPRWPSKPRRPVYSATRPSCSTPKRRPTARANCSKRASPPRISTTPAPPPWKPCGPRSWPTRPLSKRPSSRSSTARFDPRSMAASAVCMSTAGNIVKTDDTAVVTLKQVDPIYVSFPVPEQHLADHSPAYRLRGPGCPCDPALMPGPADSRPPVVHRQRD